MAQVAYIKKAFYLAGLVPFFVAVSGCSNNPDLKYKQSDYQLQQLDSYIRSSCPVHKFANLNKDVIIATLYFKDGVFQISPQQVEVLKRVVQIQQLCSSKLLVLAHTSQDEAKHNPDYSLSFKRAKSVFNYLKKHIPTTSLYYQYCSSLRPSYLESNTDANAKLSNQRVEIVLLARGVSQATLVCFTNEE